MFPAVIIASVAATQAALHHAGVESANKRPDESPMSCVANAMAVAMLPLHALMIRAVFGEIE